jgi:ParB family chromosome partitioning protein
MKLDAIKRQGQRSDLTSAQFEQKLQWSVEKVADEAGASRATVQRYIRLTELIPDLLDMVDDKKLNFNSAVEISYLPHEEQQLVHETIVSEAHAPTVAQAQEIKRLSQKKELTDDTVLSVFGNKDDSRAKVAEMPEPVVEKPPQTTTKTLNIPMERFEKYFPNRSETEITEMIFKVLDTWHHHMQKRRGQSR